MLAAIPELGDYIRDLEQRAAACSVYQGQVAQLQQRVAFLEDQFRLAQLKRFAPSSEKASGQGCLFNEAEQDAVSLPEVDEFDEMPDKQPKAPANKRGRKRLPAHLPRKRIEYDLPESEKVCACCQGALHRMCHSILNRNACPRRM